MADYQQMYLKLFNKVTDVIEELQQVQRETEELYIQGTDTELTVLQPEQDDNPEK
ncbi:hypothetical protein [Caproicibacter fermentans]|uniref:Uncharacterized protein n=1 Tax=Caproicibacter fermentans TaxID=2576756 RepID=A0A7G8T8A5_9FIRM|nr:hypothetical protein [Caproicibacter fermentans]QNK39846.1 hypothetical protein HCR03_14140 [Caproicibacter fermentans]